MNIAKFLRTPILKNTCERLLLNLASFLKDAEFQLLSCFFIVFNFYSLPSRLLFLFFILRFSFLNCYSDHEGISEKIELFFKTPTLLINEKVLMNVDFIS